MNKYPFLQMGSCALIYAIVHLLFGASFKETCAFTFRYIGIYACLCIVADVVRKLLR